MTLWKEGRMLGSCSQHDSTNSFHCSLMDSGRGGRNPSLVAKDAYTMGSFA